MVIKRGIELGFDVRQITPQQFDRDWVAQADFLIFNNFYTFPSTIYHFLLKVIWEYKKPYVVYSHDHRDIVGETARIKFARLFFQHSFLNVFISPMHERNFRECLGDIIDPVHILTPPIDIDFFYPRSTVKRLLKTAVSLSGRLVSSKGLNNVYKWAVANPDYTVSVYSKYAGGTSGKILAARPNVKIYGNIPYSMLPVVYSEHEYVIHIPESYEAAGRTIVEGALCGCKVIANENVGVMSFEDKDLPLSVGNRLKEIIYRGPYVFWYMVTKHFTSLYRNKGLGRF